MSAIRAIVDRLVSHPHFGSSSLYLLLLFNVTISLRNYLVDRLQSGVAATGIDGVELAHRHCLVLLRRHRSGLERVSH